MTQDFDGGLRKKNWSGRQDLNHLPKKPSQLVIAPLESIYTPRNTPKYHRTNIPARALVSRQLGLPRHPLNLTSVKPLFGPLLTRVLNLMTRLCITIP